MTDRNGDLPPALTLAGETELEKRLLEKALIEINQIYTSKGLETARAIGEYLLQTFFGGDLEAFLARGRKHVTFMALSEHAGLKVSASSLWYSVELLGQLRVLPEDVATALPMSHHRILMHVEDPEARKQLATEAAGENLSKRQLEDRAKALKAATPTEGARRGRPPTPNFVRVLSQLGKLRTLAETSPIVSDEVAELSGEQAKAMLHQAQVAHDALDEYIDRLREAVEKAGTA